MSADRKQRETDLNFVRCKLRKHYRQRRTAETKQEFQSADNHIQGYRDFLYDNDYPDFSEIDDLKS